MFRTVICIDWIFAIQSNAEKKEDPHRNEQNIKWNGIKPSSASSLLFTNTTKIHNGNNWRMFWFECERIEIFLSKLKAFAIVLQDKTAQNDSIFFAAALLSILFESKANTHTHLKLWYSMKCIEKRNLSKALQIHLDYGLTFSFCVFSFDSCAET